MIGTEGVDVKKIATKVWEELAPEDRDLQLSLTQSAGLDTPLALGRSPTLIELAALVCDLSRQLRHYQRIQHHLERQIALLEDQLRILPGYVVQLERRYLESEAQLRELQSSPCHNVTPASQSDTNLPEWLSVRDAAQNLQVSQSTVWRYIRQGLLPATRLPGGRAIRIHRNAMAASMRPTNRSVVQS